MKGEMNCSVGGFDALVGIGVPSMPVVMMSTSEGKLPGANRSLPAKASLKNLSIVVVETSAVQQTGKGSPSGIVDGHSSGI